MYTVLLFILPAGRAYFKARIIRNVFRVRERDSTFSAGNFTMKEDTFTNDAIEFLKQSTIRKKLFPNIKHYILPLLPSVLVRDKKEKLIDKFLKQGQR